MTSPQRVLPPAPATMSKIDELLSADEHAELTADLKRIAQAHRRGLDAANSVTMH